MAAAFDIRRTPVREAIRRLESDRLIENVPGRGLAIASLNASRVRGLYQFRTALEGASAEMAALQASEMDIAALRETLGLMRAAVMNRHFHQAVYHAARNGFLDYAIEIPRSRHRDSSITTSNR